jgi:hypothetical protein
VFYVLKVVLGLNDVFFAVWAKDDITKELSSSKRKIVSLLSFLF